jgi:hypothetical protein
MKIIESMKKKFQEYYKPTDKELEELWENCIFIFDTSVILNLYQYSVIHSDISFQVQL